MRCKSQCWTVAFHLWLEGTFIDDKLFVNPYFIAILKIQISIYLKVATYLHQVRLKFFPNLYVLALALFLRYCSIQSIWNATRSRQNGRCILIIFSFRLFKTLVENTSNTADFVQYVHTCILLSIRQKSVSNAFIIFIYFKHDSCISWSPIWMNIS